MALVNFAPVRTLKTQSRGTEPLRLHVDAGLVLLEFRLVDALAWLSGDSNEYGTHNTDKVISRYTGVLGKVSRSSSRIRLGQALVSAVKDMNMRRYLRDGPKT